MCRHEAEDDYALARSARQASEALLSRYYRLDVRKQMELHSAAGFDRAVATLATALREHAASDEDQAFRQALSALDVDWPSTTAEQRQRLIQRAVHEAGWATAAVPKRLQTLFGRAATQVVQATRRAVAQTQGLRIAADFNAVDRRLIDYLKTSQTPYVRDAYGRRHARFGARAQSIVAEGLEEGLGREAIAELLHHAAASLVRGRGRFYWEVVAGAFVSQGRTFAQLSSYAEAGIERYLISAVLDERTTDGCRFLHGKVFEVSSGLSTFEQLESSPGSLADQAPWIRERRDPKTGRKVLFVERGGERTELAHVTRSALGSRDDRGQFSRSLSAPQLADAGVGFPPYHGLCRTTTLADLR